MEAFLNSLTDESQQLFFLSIVTAFILGIALVIVVFVSRIRFLKNRLFDAKEIDESKNAKIESLLKRMEEIQAKDDALELELKQFNNTKASLKSKKELIFKMQGHLDRLEAKEKKHLETVEAYSKEFQTLSYKYKGLKKRNEFLVEENSRFRVENTKTLMKVREQERRIFEKLMSLQGNKAKQLKEIERMAESIFEKNRTLFEALRQEMVMEEIAPLSENMLQYQKEIVSSFKGSLERERDMQGDIVLQIASRQKQREKIGTLLEKLRDEKRVDQAGSEVAKAVLEFSTIEKRVVSRKSEKSNEGNEKIVVFRVALPNGQKLTVDTAFPMEAYEAYRQELEPAVKKKALEEYLDAVQKYMDNLSKNGVGKSFCWVLVPSEDALSTLCQNRGTLCSNPEKNGIVLVDPSTLQTILEQVALLWRYRQHYDLAMQLISKAEELQDRFMLHGEELSEASQRLEMIQGSLPVQANK